DVLVVGVDGDGEVVPGLPARVFVADAGVGIDGACQQGPVRAGVGAPVESLDTAGGGRDGVYDLSVRGRRRDLDALDTGAREPVGPVVELRPATSVAGGRGVDAAYRGGVDRPVRRDLHVPAHTALHVLPGGPLVLRAEDADGRRGVHVARRRVDGDAQGVPELGGLGGGEERPGGATIGGLEDARPAHGV